MNSKEEVIQCTFCQKVKKCKYSKAHGYVCHMCYKKHLAPHDTCSICGKLNNIEARKEGKIYCSKCYKKYARPKHLCSNCNNEGYIYKEVDGKQICRKCYGKSYQPKHICSICGIESVSAKRENNKYYCKKCYTRFLIPTHTCSICGIEDKAEKKIDGKYICPKCYRENYRPKSTCFFCGKDAYVAIKVDEKPACDSCYKKYFKGKHLCSICNTESFTAKIEDGRHICKKCYNKGYRPKHKCYNCGTESISYKIIDENHLCLQCYNKLCRPIYTCSICGKESFIAKNDEDKKICYSCYNKFYQPEYTCSICNRLSPATAIVEDKPICRNCYNKHIREKKECYFCSNIGLVWYKFEDKNVCNKCYKEIFKPKHLCSICNSYSVITKKIDDRLICPSCYKKLEGTCKSCGTVTKQFYHLEQLCQNCWFEKKVNAYLVSTTSMQLKNLINNLFVEFVQDLLKYRSSFSVYINLQSYLDFFIALDILPFSSSISYEQFEELSSKLGYYSSLNLQNFFVKKSLLVLPTPEQRFTKYYLALKKKLSKNFEQAYENYMNYLVSIRNNYAIKGWENKFTYDTCCQYAYASFHFTKYITAYISSYRELSSELIDEYINYTGNYGCLVIHFLKWINKNIPLFKKIKLGIYKMQTDSDPYTERDLLEIFNSLAGDSVTLRDKMVCYLLMFYAIRPAEISTITLNDFKKTELNASLYIRNTWINLHPFLSDIIDNYILRERSSKLQLEINSELLLPGSKFNKPLTVGGICKILCKYGINTHKAFRTTIINSLLNPDISPPIIIQGLGINRETVFKYYHVLNYSSLFESCQVAITDSMQDNESQDIFKSTNKYFVYILLCSDGSYYTGYTSNLNQRVIQHQNGTGCTYTKTRTPLSLVYSEELLDKSSAMRREKQIKQLTVFEKEQLIKRSKVK